MTISEDLARRFLHVNHNCRSLDALEALYVDQLGLSARMRTDPTVPSDGSVLGMDGEICCAGAFLYDARGGRRSCSMEAIEWHTPSIKADRDAAPARPGIRSTLFTVNDLQQTVAALRGAGYPVGDRIDGLISGRDAVLLVDADGVVVELAEVPSEHPGALFAGILILSVNAAATVEFMTALGFVTEEAPAAVAVSGRQLAPGSDDDSVECICARMSLVEDGAQFTVRIVEHPDTGNHPLPVGGNTQGLYRVALRVENVDKALSLLPDGVRRRGPIWCPLPGTPIDGLSVAFMDSPDGVVFEFVERPLEHFAR